MKPTILHVSKYYYPDLGGIESVAKYLAEGLRDFCNVVVCFSSDGKYHEDTVNGVKVYRVAVEMSFMSQDIALGYRKLLKRLMAEYKPQYVHVHCPNPYIYPIVMQTVSKETKVVLHWHSDILSKGLMYKLVKPFENRIVSRADAIVSTSPNYIGDSPQLDTHRGKVFVAQNGLITSLFERQIGDEEKIAELRARYGGRKLVYFVGRHAQYKGVEKLIKAEKLLRQDCEVLIAGTGPETSHWRRLAEGRPRIHFLGRLSDDELRILHLAADIFAFPSDTKAEAFGVALAEAMYCGSVPVVFHLEGSGVNWVSQKDVTGMEVPLNDVESFAGAIDKLLLDDGMRHVLADAAVRRAHGMFTEKAALLAMRDVYGKLGR